MPFEVFHTRGGHRVANLVTGHEVRDKDGNPFRFADYAAARAIAESLNSSDPVARLIAFELFVNRVPIVPYEVVDAVAATATPTRS